MRSKTITIIYVSIGGVISTIFFIMLFNLNIEQIQSEKWIGWLSLGLGIGLITMYVDGELSMKKKGVLSSRVAIPNWIADLIERPVIRDLYTATLFMIIVSISVLLMHESNNVHQLSQFAVFTLAIVHYLLNFLAKKLMNQSQPYR